MKNLVLGGKWKVEGGRNPPASRLPRSTTRSAGLTLIEMIGVMAVLSILATMLVPNIIEKIQEAQQMNEDNNLEEIAGALLMGIQKEQKFPNPSVGATNSNGWVGIGSKYSVLGTNKFWKVFPGDSRDTARRVYLDPDLTNFIGTNYVMPTGGWTNTFNPTGSYLMYIVSSSKPDLLLQCPTNTNLSSNNLSWLKNWVKVYDNQGRISATNTNVVGRVDGTTSRWTNRGQFLHVKIVNLRSMLSQVSLEDWHSPITNNPTVQQGGNITPSQGNITYQNVVLNFANNSWTITSQPDRNYQINYVNSSGGGEFRVGQLQYTTTSGNLRTLELTLPASSQYAVGTNSTQLMCDFSSANNPNRRDSTNFYALKGTVIRLYDNLSPSNLQATVILEKPNHRWAFTYGTWVDKSE